MHSWFCPFKVNKTPEALAPKWFRCLLIVKLTPLFTGSPSRCFTVRTTKLVQPDNLLAMQDVHVCFWSLCSQFVCSVTMTSTRKALPPSLPLHPAEVPPAFTVSFPFPLLPQPCPPGPIDCWHVHGALWNTEVESTFPLKLVCAAPRLSVTDKWVGEAPSGLELTFASH